MSRPNRLIIFGALPVFVVAAVGTLLIRGILLSRKPCGTASQTIAVEPVIRQLSKSNASSAGSEIAFYQLLLEGMKPIEQPHGYMNVRIRETADGKYAAFLAAGIPKSKVIVMDRQTGAEFTVPAPAARIYESRNILQLQWDNEEPVLYVAEAVTEGVTKTAAFHVLSDEQQLAQMKKDFSVVYSWKPGDAKAQILDRIKARVLAVSAAAGRVDVLSEAPEKGWSFVDFREYQNGRLISKRVFQTTIDGQPSDHAAPQILMKQKKLWFITFKLHSPSPFRPWLAMMDLNNPGVGVKLVESDVNHFIWSGNGERLVMQRAVAGKEKGTAIMSLVLLRREAMDKPILLASKKLLVGIGHKSWPQFAGFAFDGRTLYLTGLAKPVALRQDLSNPDLWRIYALSLPD